jgi:hypothetical protein
VFNSILYVFWYNNFFHVLISSFSQPAISTLFFWIWVKCLYNKQNNTWTLRDMNLSSCVQARYLTCLLRSLVRYRAWTLEDKISTRPFNIFYLYMYIVIICLYYLLYSFLVQIMQLYTINMSWHTWAIHAVYYWNVKTYL